VVEVLRRDPPSPVRRVQHFSNQHLFLHASRSRIITGYLYRRPWQLHVQAYLGEPATIVDNMLLPALHTLLSRWGLVNLHAAALARRGRGLLIMGDAAAGKSTTAMELLEAGYSFISDNDAYLELHDGRVLARGADPRLHLESDEARRFPRLAPLSRFPLRSRGGRRKRCIDLGRLWPSVCREQAPIALLLFAHVGRGAASRLRPVAPERALERLLRSAPGRGLPALIKDKPALEAQFQTLAALATTAACYDVALGRDGAELAARLGALLHPAP